MMAEQQNRPPVIVVSRRYVDSLPLIRRLAAEMLAREGRVLITSSEATKHDN